MQTGHYDEVILKRLQETELEILKEFCRICELHNLPYFATGGTAIGALRHKGFIPWDDDIDVCMLRGDYQRFMEVVSVECGSQYEFVAVEEVSKYPLMFGKLMKKGTAFVESANVETPYPLGIFIDIFPYDKTSEDFKTRRKLLRKTWFWARMHVLTLTSKPMLPEQMAAWMKLCVRGICKILTCTFPLLGITPEFTAKKYEKWALSQVENEASDLYIDYSYEFAERLTIRKKELFPLRKMTFEDIEISMVQEYDAFLRTEYGDYMQEPPVEQRHNHYAYAIDFGDEG